MRPIAVCILLGAFTLLSLTARTAGPLPGDVTVTRWLQGVFGWTDSGRSPWLGAAIQFPTGPVFVIPAAIALLVRHRPAALLLALAVATSTLLEIGLKELFARPRPSADLVDVTSRLGGYGFPSGAILQLVVLWGALYYLVRQLSTGRPRAGMLRWAVLCGGAAMLVGTSVLVVCLGAHWPTDVLGGWLVGSAASLALVPGYQWLSVHT